MTNNQFAAALSAIRPRKGSEMAQEACRLVLVDGHTQYRAAQAVGLSEAAVSRMLARLRNRCPTCGQPLR